MIQQTLVLVKPDGVQRSLVGKIISRFEDAGLKIVAMKMKHINKEHALKHYTEDISKRRGEHVRKKLVDFIIKGPVIAMVLEGVNAIEIVRKMTGDTEPLKASPGTIRGDLCHTSYNYADKKNIPVKNIMHASANEKDAESEINLWFSKEEIHTYKTVHDLHILE
jgi:nucleoside-diphosphate kinase